MTTAIVPSTDALSVADVERARQYAAASLSENTRKAHAWAWRQFQGWCSSRELDPFCGDDAGVAVYLAWMAGQEYSPTTVRLSLNAIAARLGWERRRPREACSQVLRGIFRTSPHRSGGKRALTAADLSALLEHVGDGAIGVRNRAILLVGWAGAFRRSELAALDLGDIEWTPEGMRLRVRRSKTDQTGTGLFKGIPSSRSARCPVLALRSWLTLAHPELERDLVGGISGPLPAFVSMDRWGHFLGRRITAEVVANVVKSACRRAGLSDREFAGHSLRAGFVTEAASRKKTLDAIMRTTGHRSVGQVLSYVRPATLFDDNAGEGLLD